MINLLLIINESDEIMSVQKRSQSLADFFSKERIKLISRLHRAMNDFSEMEIEDAVSDILLNLFNKADIAGQIENIAAYIYRAAYNRLVDLYRSRKRLISINAFVGEGNELAEIIPDSTSDPESETLRNDLKIRLYQAVDALEPKQRAVWIATEIEGFSFRELSERWGEPIGTLLARKHRAVSILQKSLHDLRTDPKI